MLAFEEFGIAGFADLDFLQHLPDDDFDMLVVDRHALQAIDLLDLVDEIIGQGLDAHDRQDVLRGRVALDQIIALLDEVAILHGDCPPFRDHIFDRFDAIVFRYDANALLGFVILAEFDAAVHLGEHGVIFGSARFKQFSHAR